MDDFSDIMNLPHHVSANRRKMSVADRAAQFSVFAALTGYDEDIDETARLTTAREEMSEDDIAELNAAFQHLIDSESEQPIVTIVFFQPDKRKAGGAYRIYTGQFRHYDAQKRMMIFSDQTKIAIDHITMISF